MSKFKKLEMSDAWYQEMKKYPRGYTIIENLIDWLSQTNKLIDNVNDWNEYLDDFVENFDKRLEPVAVDTLYQMAEDGTLDRIINENIFEDLNEQIEDVSSDLTSTRIELFDELGKKTDNFFDSATFTIPIDFPDIQTAINELSELKFKEGTLIDLVLMAGHYIEEPIHLVNGDYSQFRISSELDEVFLSPDFPKKNLLTLDNCRGPIINTIINCQGRNTMGIYVDSGSIIHINEGSGVTHSGTTNLYVRGGGVAYAQGAILTHGSMDGSGDASGGSGLVAWGGFVFAEGADVSNSNTYGAQAAHGGVVSFRNGIAKDCERYGVRSTNGGMMDLRGAVIENAGIHGLYLFGASLVNARGITIRNCGDAGLLCLQASNVDARDSLIEGCDRNVSVSSASRANLGQATIRNSNGVNLTVSRGGLADAWNSTITGAGGSGVYVANGGVAIVVASSVTGSEGTADLYIVDGGEINARRCRTTNSTEDRPVLGDTNALAFNSIENSFGLIWG